MTVINPQSLKFIRSAVDDALNAAAEITLPRFRQPIEVDNKDASGFDPVTIADREAEQCLRDWLTAALPHAGFLGEENSVAQINNDIAKPINLPAEIQAQLTWVVDPIDGTRAFITGAPLWGTLVALNDGDDVIFGALDQPWLGERFIGMPGLTQRVTKNSTQTLKTRPQRALGDCILQTTSPDMFKDQTRMDGFTRARDAVAMTRYGGDCYAYALLAMGGIDAVIESDLQPYDIQALIPIVQGAGGVVSNWQGQSCMNGGDVIASANASLHEQLLEKLAG